MLVELDNNNFKEATKNGVKLVEFRTDWCGYCKKQQPELEEMDKIWIGQVDADKEVTLSAKFNINSFPTFLILKNGQEVERISGMRKKEFLTDRIMKHIV